MEHEHLTHSGVAERIGEADEYLSYSQASEYLGIPRNTLYSLVAQRRIPHVRLGRRFVRFPRTELKHWVKSQFVRPVTAE